MTLRKFETAFFISFIICLIVSTLTIDKKSDNIRNEIFRFHVIAASDSEKDQKMKLLLRDEILKNSRKYFCESKNKAQAKESISKVIPEIKKDADEFLKSRGYPHSVTVKTENTFFPTKTYGKYTLPAGKYDGLRIIIGQGKGENWWCVMFPPLCIPAVSKNDISLDDILNEEEMEIITSNKYEVRFWLIEKWQKIKNEIIKN